jgi:hypothetical protein
MNEFILLYMLPAAISAVFIYYFYGFFVLAYHIFGVYNEKRINIELLITIFTPVFNIVVAIAGIIVLFKYIFSKSNE